MIPATAIAQLTEQMGERVETDAPLGALTTYRVGGTADVRVRAESAADLVAVGRIVAAHDLRVVVVGKGSNLLVADDGFRGVVVSLGEGLSGVEIDSTTVRAGGGAPLPVVARRTAAAALTGFEWAVGVPGSIGGGVRMNAGGHGSDMAASLVSVHLVDLATGVEEHLPVERLELGFRCSALRHTQVVVSAELSLAVGDRAVSEAEITEIVRWRRENQPGGANAGSVFTNPRPESAGRLIDRAGAKGLRIGTAHVSTKHANFIQVDEGGSADDVAALMTRVRSMVIEHCGIDMHAESHFLGFDPDIARAAGALLVDGDRD